MAIYLWVCAGAVIAFATAVGLSVDITVFFLYFMALYFVLLGFFMFFTNVAAYDDISITYKFWPFSKPVTVKKDDIAEVFWRENRYGIHYAINMDRPVGNYFGGVLSYVFHYRKQGLRIPIRGCSSSEKAFRAMFASHPHLLKVKN